MDAPVLLTGATGYIGGCLLRRFEDGGRAVRCVVRQPGHLRVTASTTEIVPGGCLAQRLAAPRAPACAHARLRARRQTVRAAISGVLQPLRVNS